MRTNTSDSSTTRLVRSGCGSGGGGGGGGGGGEGGGGGGRFDCFLVVGGKCVVLCFVVV